MESTSPETNKRKLQQTVLDNFSKLTYDQQNIRVKSGIALIKYLFENNPDVQKEEFELNYSVKRLIRGLGSPRVNTRNGFFATLVALLSVNAKITLGQCLQILQAELQTSSSNSKSEKGEIYLGQVLACGAIIKSNLFIKGTTEEKGKVVEILLSAGGKRTYLSLPAVTFINQLIETIDESLFKTIVVPVVKKELTKPFNLYSLNNLYLLILLRKKYPNIINNKFLKQCFGFTQLFSKDALKVFCEILVTPGIVSLKHPVYAEFSKEIAASSNLHDFLVELDNALFKFHRNKHILATVLLKHIAENSTDVSVIPRLLTQNYLKETLAYFKTLKTKQQDSEFQEQTRSFFSTILNVLKNDGVSSDVKFKVLDRLLFYPGSLVFEKITKSKLVQQIILLLDVRGVKKLATIYRDVVLGKKREHESTEDWWNSDRLYVAQLLVKLLGHHAVLNENEWRIEQIQFLMELGMIRKVNGPNVGAELAASLKTTFFRALDHKLPKLEDLKQLLSRLLHRLDSLLTIENLNETLRFPITTETYETFQQTVRMINKLEKKEQKKKKRVRTVFHTLFLQMGLQLFNDVKLATDTLQELFRCYEKIEDKKNDNTMVESEDPYWVEVITDLFLNLLSQNSHLLRTIIACVFPHLCNYMSATAMHQILSVLDPKNETNPLSHADEESESEDEANEEESSESEQDDEVDGDENETVNDKLRMAVREALGANGYQTDEESIDIDNIDEEQGKKLDEALAQAFKQFKPNLGNKKNKKQTKEDETLTHFRVRVLDLIEMYLDSEPSMLLCLEILITLLSLLEFSVRDDHQKPLQDRVRTCLKKLTAVKKFSTMDDVNETVLGDLMRSLLDKGTKNALILQDVGDKIAESCVFIIRCARLVQSLETTPKKVRKKLRNIFDEILLDALERYFKNRDCLTPYALFHNVLQCNWEGNVGLAGKLIDFAFSENVRLFRRNQALELLKLFYTNHRFLIAIKDEFYERCGEILASLSEKTISLLCGSELKINDKYISKLFNLLNAVKRCPLEQSEFNWQRIEESMQLYKSRNVLAKDGRVARHTDSTEDKEPNAKKRRKNSLESKKMKKEAKLKRLQLSSEGFEHHVPFAGADLSKVKEDNQDSGTGSLDEESEGVSRKRKIAEASNSGKKKMKC